MPDPLIRDPLVGPLAAQMGVSEPFLAVLSLVILAWIVYWKAVALWAAAQNRQVIWFGVLLVIHTVGILEIIYLIFFEKEKKEGRTHLLPLPKFIGKARAFVSKSNKQPTK